jgi:hypothetical protein
MAPHLRWKRPAHRAVVGGGEEQPQEAQQVGRLLTRRARHASGTATQSTRTNDSRSLSGRHPPPPPPASPPSPSRDAPLPPPACAPRRTTPMPPSRAHASHTPRTRPVLPPAIVDGRLARAQQRASTRRPGRAQGVCERCGVGRTARAPPASAPPARHPRPPALPCCRARRRRPPPPPPHLRPVRRRRRAQPGQTISVPRDVLIMMRTQV